MACAEERACFAEGEHLVRGNRGAGLMKMWREGI